MGIYIKSMEMPKCCARCELCQDEMYCNVTGLCVEFSTMYDKRMDNCPLTEVSEPHGRLIDADACIDYIRNNNQHAWETLAYAPTVIERSDK